MPRADRANKPKTYSTAAKTAAKRKSPEDEPELSADARKRPRRNPARTPKKQSDDADGDENETTHTTGTGSTELLLAHKWDIDAGVDPKGWWVSEKLDGVRVFYDGKSLYSRLGNPFTAPRWFLKSLPKDVTLDGELFTGRGAFSETVSIVKTQNSPNWNKIKFHIFDIPSHGLRPFEARVDLLQKLFGPEGTHAVDHVVLVEQTKVKDRNHVIDLLKDVEGRGGEGLMLRQPKSVYEGRRSHTLLKVKNFYDAEARVIGHFKGSGKNATVTGALECVMESGDKFKVGSGLTDKQRKNPPKIGSIITYRFQELSKRGHPRFPTFVGEAIDKTEPKDAEVPEHRRGADKAKDDEE